MQPAEVGADLVAEVLGETLVPVQGHVHTHVKDLCPVACHGGVLHRACGTDHGVAGQTIVPVDVAGEVVVGGGEVQADVGLVDGLPAEPAEGRTVDVAVEGVVGAEHGTCRSAGCIACTGCNLVVTELAPAGTKLQVLEEVLVLHEVLVGDYPGCTYRGEEAPRLVVLRTAVLAEGYHEQVLVGVVVVETCEVGEGTVAETAVTQGDAFLVTQREVLPAVLSLGYVLCGAPKAVVALLAQ